MSGFTKFMDSMVEVDNFLISEMGGIFIDNKLHQIHDQVKKNMAIYKKNGGITGFQNILKSLESLNIANKTINMKKEKNISTDDDSCKENSIENIISSKDNIENSDSGRPRRRAFREASQVMSIQVNQTLNTKLRRPTEQMSASVVKIERLSDDLMPVRGEMLPPTDIPLKKTQKRKGAIKKEKIIGEDEVEPTRTRSTCNTRRNPTRATSQIRDSEIIIEIPETVIISLDTDGEEGEDVEAAPTRSTRRTRQNNKATDNSKRIRSLSQEEVKKLSTSKRTKRKKTIINGESEKQLESSIYEDAVSVATTDNEPARRTSQSDKASKISSLKQLPKISQGKKSSIKQTEEDENISDKILPMSANETFQVNATMVVQQKKSANVTDVVDSANTVNNTVVSSQVNETMVIGTKVNETMVIGSKVNETMVIGSKVNETMVIGSNVNETMVIGSKVNETMVIGSKVNETMVIGSKVNETMNIVPKVNETMVVTKQINVNKDNINQQVLDAIMTDDESIEEKITKPTKGTKPIFNPFENSPVKKRVEAFEKLVTKTPVNQPTRTNIGSLVKKSGSKRDGSQIPLKNDNKKTTVTTPLSVSRHMRSASANRYNSSNVVASVTLSAMKAQQQDFKKREQLRREKDTEAARKKDALIQAQIEEKRKKREEKELKAKQQRDALEKEKLKVLELQKAKEAKQRLILLDKQEKLQKLREDNEKKRQLAKQKYEERKKADLVLRQKETDTIKKPPLKNGAKAKDLPIYMLEKAPLLPTYDCYDSDEAAPDPDTTIVKPLWINRDNLHTSLRTMEFIEDKWKNTLFCPKPQTPDLQDIFENIDPHKLKRNSSAIWNTQPRFTIMPTLSDTSYV